MNTRLSRLAGLSAAVVALAACSRTATPPSGELPPLAIETAPVVLSTEPVPVEVSGVLSRRTEAQLSFKTGGVIASVAVRAGDAVRAGQELAALRLDELDAQVVQARTAVEKAERDLTRVTNLHADRVATLENLQDARSARDVAAAGLRAAEFNRAHAVITAPDNGHILHRYAEPDELAAPGRPILAFAGDGEGWIVKVGVTERDVLRLRTGDRAEVAGPDGLSLAAVVAQIAEGTDAATRTIEVQLQLTSPVPAGLRSGFLVTTRIWPAAVPARPQVPLAAIVEGRARQAHVFLLAADGRHVSRQAVELEAIHGERAYLRSALPAGARIATTGAEFLADGRAVLDTTANRPNAAAQP